MIERADSDGDGFVTFEDFYNILTKKTFAWFFNTLILKFLEILCKYWK